MEAATPLFVGGPAFTGVPNLYDRNDDVRGVGLESIDHSLS